MICVLLLNFANIQIKIPEHVATPTVLYYNLLSHNHCFPFENIVVVFVVVVSRQ